MANLTDKLEMFIALAREKHFGRAAESLNISQPTLSAGIKQLEDQLGVQLVYRGSRFGGLTPEGLSALAWAHRIVADVRQLHDEMRAKRHGLSGQIRLAVIPTAQTWAARLASSVTRRHPKVTFTILARNSREILQMLEAFEAEAGISYLDNEPLGRVDVTRLYTENYMLVCPPDSPVARQSRVTWPELDAMPLALLTPDMQHRRILNQIFVDHGVSPHTYMESNSIIALVAAVADGGCMALLPTDIARFLAHDKDLALVPLSHSHGRQGIGLILPQHEPRPPVIEALLKAATTLRADKPA